MARPRLVSDQQILDATRVAVLEKGAQVSLDAVGEQLGITSPALIKRFGTRQNLLLSALMPDIAELDAIFTAPPGHEALGAQLEGMISRVAQYFRHTMPRLMALRECVSHDVLHARIKAPLPLHAITGMTRWLGALHRRGLIEGEMLETIASAIVGAIMARVVSAHLAQQSLTPRAQRKFEMELAALFTRALSTPSEVSSVSVSAPASKRRSRRRTIQS